MRVLMLVVDLSALNIFVTPFDQGTIEFPRRGGCRKAPLFSKAAEERPKAYPFLE